MVMRGWQARLKISLEMAHEIVQAAVQHNDKSVQPFFITIPTVVDVVSPLRYSENSELADLGRLPRTVYSLLPPFADRAARTASQLASARINVVSCGHLQSELP